MRRLHNNSSSTHRKHLRPLLLLPVLLLDSSQHQHLQISLLLLLVVVMLQLRHGMWTWQKLDPRGSKQQHHSVQLVLQQLAALRKRRQMQLLHCLDSAAVMHQQLHPWSTQQ